MASGRNLATKYVFPTCVAALVCYATLHMLPWSNRNEEFVNKASEPNKPHISKFASGVSVQNESAKAPMNQATGLEAATTGRNKPTGVPETLTNLPEALHRFADEDKNIFISITDFA